MSQSHITKRPDLSDQHNTDWMRELEVDANNFQAVMNRVHTLCNQAHFSITHGDKWGAGMKIEEIKEGLRLAGELVGIKVGEN